jgi:hypothetical protein
MVGRHVAADDDIVDDAEFGGVSVKFVLDIVDAADELSDIDDQRLQPALSEDRADLEQGLRLLARVDRTEMADYQPSLLARGGKPLQKS